VAIISHTMVRLLIFSFIAFISACNLDKKNKPTSNQQQTKLTMTDTTNSEIKLTTKFNSFDTKVEVIFTDTQDSINEIQKKNFDNFVSNQDLLTTEIIQKIFDFYNSSYADYKSGWTMTGQISNEELEKHLPKPTTPENLKRFITPAIIHIQNKKDCTEGTIGIEFDCTWDIENGLGVLIKDWKVIKVSVAEISYF